MVKNKNYHSRQLIAINENHNNEGINNELDQ